ncbi:MAG: nucleotidyltransferase domain-containing protein [Elusimicrobiota bacterium]
MNNKWGYLTDREKRIIASLTKKLRKKLDKEIVEIKLFGSRVKGNYLPDSDIDLFILVKRKKIKVSDVVDKIIFDCVFNYNLPLSPVLYDLSEFRQNLKLGSFFFENVQKEGIDIWHE